MSTALNYFLQDIYTYLAQDDVNEVIINKPHEVFIEQNRKIKVIKDEYLTFERLLSIAELIAKHTKQEISRIRPLLSASLPTGERIQIIIPPAVDEKNICFSIRKQSVANLDLKDYLKNFESPPERITDSELLDSYSLAMQSNDPMLKIDFLKKSVVAKKNIIISGGTATGKTTFMNTLLKEVPYHERIITIEDVFEVDVKQPNNVRLKASKGGQGEANVTYISLLEACLRLRPDRIMMSEIRGEEAFSFLESLNTGHAGSISTIHANTVKGAIEQIAMKSLRGSSGYSKSDLIDYIHNVIDVIVQLERINEQLFITDIYFGRE